MSTREDLRALGERLKREWCETFYVTVETEHRIVITPPFVFGDGDAYPVVIELRRDGWHVSDGGLAVPHLQNTELELTDTRVRQIEGFAQAYGCAYADGRLSMPLGESAPDGEDIVSFIKLVALVEGLPLHVLPERESEQFRTRARRRVETWLRRPDAAEENWAPSEPRGELFRADLWLPARDRPVVAFFAASNGKAERSMAFVGEYSKWGLNLKPLLIHNGALNSDTRYRAGSVLEDDDAVVEVNENATVTGFMALHRTLTAVGVDVLPQ